MHMAIYAEVAVDFPEAAQRTFTYLAVDKNISPGELVRVPFGSNQRYGVVVSVTNEPSIEPEAVKTVSERITGERFIDKERLLLAQWLSEYYRSSMFAACSLMLPTGISSRLRRLVWRNIEPYTESFEALPPRLRLDLQIAPPKDKPITDKALARKFGRGGAERVARLIRRGILGSVTELPPPRMKIKEQREDEKDPLRSYKVEPSVSLRLTREQAIAVAAVTGGLKYHTGRFLLFGVTGSGKTEVYMRAAAKCLEKERRVLVLVPEIALTPQMVGRFLSRFGERVGIMHSGLTARERFDEWMRIHRGGRDVVLGTRSALFSPVKGLGLVIMDEEHEWAYDQHDTHPRYHARNVAERLCDLTGATLILGSATPDVVSFRRAERNDLQLLRLRSRPEAARDVEVTVVDMREELKAGHFGIISRRLESMMREDLNAGGHVLLLLNRRGAASFFQCLECGAMRECPHCDVVLVYHLPEKRGRVPRLQCHYCGYSVSAKKSCVACGGNLVSRKGAGVQALEQVVGEIFPEYKMLRWDSDVVKNVKTHAEIIDAIRNRGARIVVGTQMIAGGHHFPEVTLSAAVAADIGLGKPDFRAPERTFQILTQLTGRAGRGACPGRAVIQSLNPDHYAIASAAVQDYETFYNLEIDIRAKHNLPPFTHIIRLGYAGFDMDVAYKEVTKYAQELRIIRDATGHSEVDVTGPLPAWPFRVRRRYRWHIDLISTNLGSLELLLGSAPVRRQWTVDVDPINLL